MFSKKAREAWDSVQDAAQHIDTLWRFIVDVDRPRVMRYVAEQRARHPGLGEDELIDRLYDASRLNAMALGFVSGLPGGLVAIPAALSEFYALARIESLLIGCVAHLKNDAAFQASNFGVHVAVVLAGQEAIDQLLAGQQVPGKEAGQVRGTWRMVNGVLVPGRMDWAKRILQSCVRSRLLVRATSRSLPLLGGVIGAAFNWREVRIVLADARRYFTA